MKISVIIWWLTSNTLAIDVYYYEVMCQNLYMVQMLVKAVRFLIIMITRLYTCTKQAANYFSHVRITHCRNNLQENYCTWQMAP